MLKIFEPKVEALPANASLCITSFLFIAIIYIASFGLYQLILMPEIVSKLLQLATWSGSAVQIMESEHMPFSLSGCPFRSAALHRIQFGTFLFVPMPEIYPETNAWLSEGLSTPLVCNTFSPNQLKFKFSWEKIYHHSQKFQVAIS